MKRSGTKETLFKVLAVLFWLVLWQVGAMLLDKSIILVTPLAAVKRLWELIFEGDFLRTVMNSVLRICGGFLLALAFGTALAALSARFGAAKLLISPVMSAVKAVPVASFIIFALFFIKSSQLSVLIVFLMVIPVIYEGVVKGIGSADRYLIEAADIFRLGRLKRIRYIYFPAVYPFLEAACRTAAAIAFKSGTAAEVIGQPDFTVGDMLYRAKIYLETADLFAWTMVIIILGKLFEFLVCKVLGFIYTRSQRVNFKGGVCSDD